ncbi:MAG TPA: cytochrome c oxidase assembly protein [Solirubrobacteraceae bacterium]|nr:cytochrome c oxidase assembly protein [Solirubrobacteraceae bacterium]
MTVLGQIAIAAGMPSLARIVTSWQPGIAVLAGCGLAAALYALAVTRRRRPWPPQRTLAFALGLIAVVVSLDSGLDLYGDQLASVHMVQHLALTLVAAPLLAAGAPLALALGATRGAARARLVSVIASPPVRALTQPLGCWLLFVGTIVGWHLSPLYNLSLGHPLLHDLEHLLLLVTAVLFWAQVLRVDPLPHPLGPLGRLLYLLAAMPAMSVIGVWLVVSRALRYPAYAAPARALGISALHDQHLAGVIMWGGDALLGVITLVIACRALLQEERRAAARDSYREAGGSPVEIGGAAP